MHLDSILSLLTLDRVGRRYDMLRTLPFFFLAWLVVASGLFMLEYTNTKTNSLGGYFAFFGTMGFLFAFIIGMASTPWTVCAEIFPLHVIGTVNSLTTTTNWLTNYLVAQFFPLMLNSEKIKGWGFIILAVFSALSWLFIYLILPETANKEVS